MSEPMKIQWYPGHMTKTRRQMTQALTLVDAAVEILDARVPASSTNPDLKSILVHKPRLVLLNKADAADPSINREWISWYADQGIEALAVDCRSGSGLREFLPAVRRLLKERLDRLQAKGMGGMPLRLIVVGIPNVGKSSFINRMAGSAGAKVADRPGVTRGNQWFSAGKGVDLLDTPGVLWPKFDDPQVGEYLAFTGAVKDQVLDVERLACRLLARLEQDYRPALCKRYRLQETDFSTPEDLLETIGAKRGMRIAGGAVDTERAAVMVLDEFRGRKIGRISLERPTV